LRGRGGDTGERFLSFKGFRGREGEGSGKGCVAAAAAAVVVVVVVLLLCREHSGHGSVPFENLSRGPVIN